MFLPLRFRIAASIVPLKIALEMIGQEQCVTTAVRRGCAHAPQTVLGFLIMGGHLCWVSCRAVKARRLPHAGCWQPRDGLGLLRVGFGVQDVHSGCVMHVEIACQGYNFQVQNGYKNGVFQVRPSCGARTWKEGARSCLLLGAACSAHKKQGNEFKRSF